MNVTKVKVKSCNSCLELGTRIYINFFKKSPLQFNSFKINICNKNNKMIILQRKFKFA